MRKTITVIAEFCGFEIELDVKIDNPPDDDFEVVDITDPHEEVTGFKYIYDSSFEFKREINNAVREVLTNE